MNSHALIYPPCRIMQPPRASTSIYSGILTSTIISGSVTHTIQVVVNNTQKVKFDSSKLHVSGVSVNGVPATYERAESSPSLGTCLAVEIPANLRKAGAEFDMTFHYATDKNASAVQWLTSKATSSGNHPFVFTQVCSATPYLYPCILELIRMSSHHK